MSHYGAAPNAGTATLPVADRRNQTETAGGIGFERFLALTAVQDCDADVQYFRANGSSRPKPVLQPVADRASNYASISGKIAKALRY